MPQCICGVICLLLPLNFLRSFHFTHFKQNLRLSKMSFSTWSHINLLRLNYFSTLLFLHDKVFLLCYSQLGSSCVPLCSHNYGSLLYFFISLHTEMFSFKDLIQNEGILCFYLSAVRSVPYISCLFNCSLSSLA